MTALYERPLAATRADAAVSSIARRAIDLANDERATSEEAAEHLQRLARDRHEILIVALQELGPRSDVPEVLCARRLLLQAIGRTRRTPPPRQATTSTT